MIDKLLIKSFCFICILGCSFPFLYTAYSQERGTDASALMALYTYNFAKFTTWPRSVWLDKNAPLNLCTLGEDPFGTAASKIEGKQIQQHPLLIKHYPRVAVLDGCHIVFISRSENWRLDTILHDLTASATLTVSDMPDFAERGGMIALKTQDQKLRFHINLAAATRAGLRFSSKLLELAQLVDR